MWVLKYFIMLKAKETELSKAKSDNLFRKIMKNFKTEENNE